jgi:hypothetical protein
MYSLSYNSQIECFTTHVDMDILLVLLCETRAQNLSAPFSYTLYNINRNTELLWLARGWTTERLEFESRYIQEFSLLHVVQTGSGAEPASYSVGNWGSFSGGKADGAWSWPLTWNYCRGQENMDLYIHSPIRLHGVVFN